MKKIVFVSAGILPVPPVKGGAVESLIDFIIKENEKNKKYKITVISIYNEVAVKQVENYKNANFEYINIDKKLNTICNLYTRVINKLFNCKKSLNSLYLKLAFKKIKENDYDYIIVENCVEFMPYVMNKRFNDKLLLHIHNDYLNVGTKKANLIIESCNKVITVSEFIKKRVLTLGEKYSSKVLVLKNCTDVNKFDKTLYYDFRKTFREENKISKDDVVIIFSGRIHETKGIKELILAFSKINNNNAKLLIVGSSWYGSESKTEYAREVEYLSRGLKDRIIFTGFIPFEDMPKIYSVADIAIIPSIWDDPAPLVVFEAMSSGLPLITTDSGGIPEYISEECAVIIKRDNNLIDNLTKSLVELIKNKNKRDEWGNKARKHAIKFNTKQYYRDFINIMGDDNE